MTDADYVASVYAAVKLERKPQRDAIAKLKRKIRTMNRRIAALREYNANGRKLIEMLKTA